MCVIYGENINIAGWDLTEEANQRQYQRAVQNWKWIINVFPSELINNVFFMYSIYLNFLIELIKICCNTIT